MDRARGAAVEPGLTLPDELLQRTARWGAGGRRVLLGIAGPPGAGTSTVAAALVASLGRRAALVPMDGFHLAGSELARLGRAGRKGAPDTFDAAGYVALLRRLIEQIDEVVYAPVFTRQDERAEAGALAVPRDVPVVVTEGNYLLMDGPFAPVRGLLTECWYLDVDPQVRQQRLVARHVRHGRTPEQARAWVAETDEPNARTVERTRSLADLVVRLP